MPESLAQRLAAMTAKAAEIEMELQAVEKELERVIRSNLGIAPESYVQRALAESRARIAAKLANPDEGGSGRRH